MGFRHGRTNFDVTIKYQSSLWKRLSRSWATIVAHDASPRVNIVETSKLSCARLSLDAVELPSEQLQLFQNDRSSLLNHLDLPVNRLALDFGINNGSR
jgi:hypothetical protein